MKLSHYYQLFESDFDQQIKALEKKLTKHAGDGG